AALQGLRPCDLLAFAAAALNLCLLGGIASILKTIDHRQFTYGVPMIMQILLTLPVIALALTAILTMIGARMWVTGGTSLTTRLRATTWVVPLWAFFPLITYWNLIGWQ
ncbi:MAG: hypothetical protein ACREIT_07760, partial [Tepidisphaeraceae bacterium]